MTSKMHVYQFGLKLYGIQIIIVNNIELNG